MSDGERAPEVAHAPEPAPQGLLSTGPGGVTAATFVALARDRVQAMVEARLRGTPYEGRPCPWIPYVADRFSGRSEAEVERALALFLRGAVPRSIDEAIEGIVARSQERLDAWLRDGAPDVPVPSTDRGLAYHGLAPQTSTMWGLGAGQPLPVSQQGLARRVGADPSVIRLHTGEAASRAAGGTAARAFAVGNEVAFGRGQYQPGTVLGDLILAHELAHAAQHQQGTAGDSTSLEADADGRALSALAPTWGLPAVATRHRTQPGGGLLLRRCGDPEPIDESWREEEAETYDEIAQRIRTNLAEFQQIAGNANPSEADFARSSELWRLIQEDLELLRAQGHREDDVQLLARIQAGETRGNALHILALIGADPPTLSWGERRSFGVEVDFIPEDVQIFVEWYVQTNDGDDPWAATNSGLPPELTASDPNGSQVLGNDVWLGPVGRALRSGGATALRVGAKLRVGSQIDDTMWTDWLTVSMSPPANIEILHTGTQSYEDPQTHTAQVIVLQNAMAGFRLSWLAPPLTGFDTGHVIEWTSTDPSGATDTRFGDPQTEASRTFATTGAWSVRGDVRPAQQQSFGRVTTSPPIASASLSFTVVSSLDLSQRALDAYQAHGVDSYATALAELDDNIEHAGAARAHGSAAGWQLAQRHEGLVEMRQAIVDKLGVAPVPLPETGELDRSATYVLPVPAVMAVPEAHGAVPLRIYVRIDASGTDQWVAKLVDATTQDVVEFRGSAGADPVAAVRSALSAWHADNEFPQGGTVRYAVSVRGTPIADTYSTSSTEKSFWEWFDRILFIGQALLAILLLLTPEPTGLTKAAGVALLVAGILRGMYRIYESLNLGRPLLHEQHILEALGIVSAALGLGGAGAMARAGSTALAGEALAGRALVQFNIGRGVALTGVGLDVGTTVWVAHGSFAQMRSIAEDTSVPEAERQSRIDNMVLQLAAQGLLLIATSRDAFSGGRGTRARGVFDHLGAVELDPVYRSRIEVTLRRMGVTDDLGAMGDRALFERYTSMQEARGRVAAAAEAVGGTRGRGIYEEAPSGTLTPDTARAAGTGLDTDLSLPGMPRRLTLHAPDATGRVDGELVIELPPPAAGGAVEAVTIPVRVVVGDLAPVASGHGSEGGMARVTIGGDATGWRVTIELDSRIASQGDARTHLLHELREASDIIGRAHRDPAVDIAAEQQARVFGGGNPTADLSGHDRAQARELLDLHTALGAAASGTTLNRTGLAAERRLDAALDVAGFYDPAHRAALRERLKQELGLADDHPLLAYIDRYGERLTRHIEAEAAWGELPQDVRQNVSARLSPPMLASLQMRVPPALVTRISTLLSSHRPPSGGADLMASAVNTVLASHRNSRLGDADANLAAGVDIIAARANDLPARRGQPTQLDPAFATSLVGGPTASNAALTQFVTTGISHRPPAGPTVQIRAEADLIGNGYHGLGWSDADALTRINTPRESPDQGRFGSVADLAFAVKAADMRLQPAGSGVSEGIVPLPAGHTSVVLRADPSTPGAVIALPADHLFLLVYSSGEVHGYPIILASPNFTRGTLPLLAAVPW